MKNNNVFAEDIVTSVTTAFDELFFYYIPDENFMMLIPGRMCVYQLSNLEISDCREYGFDFVHPEDRKLFRKKLDMPNTEPFELRLLGSDEKWIWSECQMQRVVVSNGKLFYAGKIMNVDDRKQREMRLLEENAKDVLTGLMNRTALKECLSMYLHNRISGFLFMIDIDNFKIINDTLGHAAGDDMLRKFAVVLRSVFRSTDLVGRIGGDEFVAYMLDTQDRERAGYKAENVMEKLSALSASEKVELSVSMGIADCPEDGKEYEELLHKADIAMYEAKAEGKKRYCFYRST